ncbi:MAG: 60S ribosomal export protein NMD3 [Candidatus Thorarchaeota archaeon]
MTLTAPCYECGEKSVVDGLCEQCYNKAHPLLEVRSPLKLIACKRCDAVKVPGGWKPIVKHVSDPEELVEHQLDILFQQEVKLNAANVLLEYFEEKRLDRVRHLILTATGRSHPEIPPHSEDYPMEVRFSFATCDTCAMMSGGYHEAILQVRADGREVTEEEIDEIVSLATDLTVAKYGKDVKAFITEIKRDKYGLDFKIGSEHLSKRIADELESKYLAERKENYRLIGEDKGGKKKYRITILIRLPQFTLGDFVRVDKKPCQVLAMGKGGLSCYGLTDGDRFTINPKSAKWRTLEFISPESEKRQFMVVSHVYGQPVQVMDSLTFEVHDIEEKDLLFEVSSGQTIFALKLEEKIHLLPPEN